MEYAELGAPPPLDRLVHCFWFLRGAGGPPQTIVADGRLEIILHLGEPFLRLDDGGVARKQASVLVSGQLTRPVRLAPAGDTDIVGIRFRTAAAATLLSFPLAAVTDQVIALSELMPRLGSELVAAAAGAGDPAGRSASLAAVLLRRLRGMPDPLAGEFVRALDRPGAPGIGAAADRLGVSARTVERRLLHTTGLAPARLRRVLRFRRAFTLLDRSPPGTWAGVAARTGYYDQAHLIRDFRGFTGSTPTAFFATDPELARAFLADEASGA